MSKGPRHRPRRSFPNAKRVIVECELEKCIHCGEPLVPGKTWHMRKNVQTMEGPLFVAGKSKKCAHPSCGHSGTHYHASGVLRISLPYSTYGLDVLAFIGWQHEHEHKQLVEIQQKLNQRGVEVNERNVGKLYRQFLALLGGLNERTEKRLKEAAEEHGGLVWGIDALQPEGHGTLLYVLYEVLSGTPVDAIQADYPTADELLAWLQPYRELPFKVLATLSDGEDRIIAALRSSWPTAPHQRCQEHVLGNLAEPVLKVDTQLRTRMRDDLGGLPAVPTQSESGVTGVGDGQPVMPTQSEPWVAQASGEQPAVPTQAESSVTSVSDGPPAPAPPFLPTPSGQRDEELMEVEARIRVAIRDAVNRPSRKPFHWGGLKGYQQLQAISQVLQSVPSGEPETSYLQRLAMQVDRAVEKNRVLAQDVQEAHTWLLRIAECLRYPPSSSSPSDSSETSLTSEQVKREMEQLLQEFQPDLKRRPAQAALYRAWHRVWEDCGSDWLHCYDIPALPPDNLQLESLFGRLRSHQRRISGRKSTRELRDFGQFQVLFLAESEADLLKQLRQVPLAAYQARRCRLAEAEAPRQLLRRLHRDPLRTMRDLVDQHAARRTALASHTGLPPPRSDN